MSVKVLNVNIVKFPRVRYPSPLSADEERARLTELFGGQTQQAMRRFWDSTSASKYGYYHGGEGDFHRDDIRAFMILSGDGEYCGP